MVPDGKVGLVAEPGAASIAEKIMQFYEMGEDHFIPGIWEEKNKYTWDNMVRAIEEVSENVRM